MKQITVQGNTYTSITAAWRETGKVVKLTTVRWRLREGWHPDDAFLLPLVDPEDRRMFVTNRRTFDEVAA